MSVGDLLWKVDPSNPQGVFGSPQREAERRRQRRNEKLEASRERQAQLDEELRQLKQRYPLEYQGAIDAFNIDNTRRENEARRESQTATRNANLLANTVLPATTQSTIAINDNDYKGKIGLTETVGKVASNLQSEGITARSNAAEKFFPTLTSQITTLQKAPVDLATQAILSQETMAQKDRDFIKEMYLLQNPKRNFGQQLLSAAPGLAAAALLAFS